MSQGLYYADYLKLDKILDAQELESAKRGHPAHDETLFIIIHQTYELWFKQILHELSSIQQIFNQQKVPEESISTVVARLQRVISIEKVLVDQLTIIETMTPLDFMEFRDYLLPASGFQSLQFRLVETMLGLKDKHRMDTEKKFFNSRLSSTDKKTLEQAQGQPSLLELIEKWLERMPFVKKDGFNFWQSYQEVVKQTLANDRKVIENNATLTDQQRHIELANLDSAARNFDILFDDKLYQNFLDKDQKRLSRKATLAALFISLYREEPILTLPYQLLNALLDVDELLTAWRYRHAIMAHRLLGNKIGTGGSSGHEYLKASAENNRIFKDFFDLPSYLVPLSKRPPLPQVICEQLNFRFQSL